MTTEGKNGSITGWASTFPSCVCVSCLHAQTLGKIQLFLLILWQIPLIRYQTMPVERDALRGASFLLAFAQLCYYPLWYRIKKPIFADESVTNRCESKNRTDHSIRTLSFFSSISKTTQFPLMSIISQRGNVNSKSFHSKVRKVSGRKLFYKQLFIRFIFKLIKLSEQFLILFVLKFTHLINTYWETNRYWGNKPVPKKREKPVYSFCPHWVHSSASRAHMASKQQDIKYKCKSTKERQHIWR